MLWKCFCVKICLCDFVSRFAKILTMEEMFSKQEIAYVSQCGVRSHNFLEWGSKSISQDCQPCSILNVHLSVLACHAGHFRTVFFLLNAQHYSKNENRPHHLLWPTFLQVVLSSYSIRSLPNIARGAKEANCFISLVQVTHRHPVVPTQHSIPSIGLQICFCARIQETTT